MDKNNEDPVFFSHNKPYNPLEHGIHLNLMLDAVENEIENLANLRALVDINFIRTRKYFRVQLIFYTIFCSIPFIAMS